MTDTEINLAIQAYLGLKPTVVRFVKDYCNDRDAMADAISKMKVHDTGDFTEELAPHWLDSEIQGDELIEFTLLILTKPCHDLAVAYVKAIGKWKSTETPTEKYVQ